MHLPSSLSLGIYSRKLLPSLSKKALFSSLVNHFPLYLLYALIRFLYNNNNSGILFKLSKMSEASPSSKKTCPIERVPDIIREANESVYTPQLLSTGPYHKPKPNKHCPNLEKMEPIKLQYMKALLLRNRERSNLASEIKREMMVSVRSCYTEVEKMDKEEFVTMMMLDGCFIILTLSEYGICRC